MSNNITHPSLKRRFILESNSFHKQQVGDIDMSQNGKQNLVVSKRHEVTMDLMNVFFYASLNWNGISELIYT